MTQENITVTPYYGSVLADSLLTDSTNLVLSSFGPSQTGTLDDNDGWLSDADNGVSTFDGVALNYVGSGTATPGIDLGLAFVATGSPVDVVIFEAGGQMYFHYPNGEPNFTGALLLNVDITSDAYQVFTPICFCEGTLIRTVLGEIPIEELHAGDEVVDIFGDNHEIVWIGSRKLEIPRSARFDKWRPVRIAKGALGSGQPYLATWVSQQHRLLLSDYRIEMNFGLDQVLVPAKSLVNDRSIIVDRTTDRVEYWHLMCREHVILVANGLPAESLFPGALALEGVTESARQEIMELFPELTGGVGTGAYRMFAPELKARDAALLTG